MIQENRDRHGQIARRLQDTVRLQAALKRAARDAVQQHALAGRKIAVWRDGQVVWEEASHNTVETLAVERRMTDRVCEQDTKLAKLAGPQALLRPALALGQASRWRTARRSPAHGHLQRHRTNDAHWTPWPNPPSEQRAHAPCRVKPPRPPGRNRQGRQSCRSVPPAHPP